MALFKILKGNSSNLGDTNSDNSKLTHEGYAYFVMDTGKLYIDINSNAVPVLSDINTPAVITGANRIALNAATADYAKQNVSAITKGDTNGYLKYTKNQNNSLVEIYTHPSYTAQNNGFYKVTVDDLGHVSNVTNVVKSDITNLLGLTPTDNTGTVTRVEVGDGLIIGTNGTSFSTAGRINHADSITAQTAYSVFKKLKYNSTGHITATQDVAPVDISDALGYTPSAYFLVGDGLDVVPLIGAYYNSDYALLHETLGIPDLFEYPLYSELEDNSSYQFPVISIYNPVTPSTDTLMPLLFIESNYTHQIVEGYRARCSFHNDINISDDYFYLQVYDDSSDVLSLSRDFYFYVQEWIFNGSSSVSNDNIDQWSDVSQCTTTWRPHKNDKIPFQLISLMQALTYGHCTNTYTNQCLDFTISFGWNGDGSLIPDPIVEDYALIEPYNLTLLFHQDHQYNNTIFYKLLGIQSGSNLDRVSGEDARLLTVSLLDPGVPYDLTHIYNKYADYNDLMATPEVLKFGISAIPLEEEAYGFCILIKPRSISNFMLGDPLFTFDQTKIFAGDSISASTLKSALSIPSSGTILTDRSEYTMKNGGGIPYPAVKRDFSFSSGSTSCSYTSSYFSGHSLVVSIVVTSGESYLSGPINWNSSANKITLTTTAATSGVVSGYFIAVNGIVLGS